MSLTLTKATDSQTVTALDQNGHPYLGDLSSTTVTVDQPGFVGASLSAFVDGVATLTLTQGSPGTANVTITNGAITVTESVESYTPVLTSFQVGSLT